MEITLEKLMELRVLRKSIFDNDGTWFVIYTEDGPKDITLAELSSDVSKELCDSCNGADEDRYEQRCRFCLRHY